MLNADLVIVVFLIFIANFTYVLNCSNIMVYYNFIILLKQPFHNISDCWLDFSVNSFSLANQCFEIDSWNILINKFSVRCYYLSRFYNKESISFPFHFQIVDMLCPYTKFPISSSFSNQNISISYSLNHSLFEFSCHKQVLFVHHFV